MMISRKYVTSSQSGRIQNLLRRHILPTCHMHTNANAHIHTTPIDAGSSASMRTVSSLSSNKFVPHTTHDVISVGSKCRYFATSTIADHLTIKTEGEVADEDADPPSIIDKIPLYNDFFTRPELYQRIHVHLVGVRAKDPEDSNAGLHAKSLFGQGESLLRNVHPSVTVDTFGANTGSTDYFPIGEHTFLERPKDSLPIWDATAMVVCRKGSENTEGIKFTMLDSKSELFECKVPSADFPAIGEDWKEFVHSPEESKTVKGLEFVYKIRVTGCEDKISDKDTLANFLTDTDSISYSEEVIEGASQTDNALVQCWRHKKLASKAVLWVLGRNDCFMHADVAKTLFTDKGYDLYVLNYSSVGLCRKRGWLDSAHFNSHNSYGDFDSYLDQIDGATAIMKDYDKVIGYAHSTGGPVLINYLMKKGDDKFNGFIFNSPFLDWGADAVGSEMGEFALEHFDVLTSVTPMNNDAKLGAAKTPEELKHTPIEYIGEEIVFSAWSAKVWSQHYFDFRSRPLYEVPMTPGFAKGVTGVHNELAKWKEEKKYVTLKPMMCITSRADDILTAAETLARIDTVGPARCEIELRHNSHDVFLSHEESDVSMAVEMTKVWMDSNGFE